VSFELGLPEASADAPLSRRLAWVTAARLLFLMAALAIFGFFYLKRALSFDTFSVQLALITLAGAFACAGVYAAILRSGRGLTVLAGAQLLVDQLTWTIIVYLSGGTSSGATSFYGLTCLVGAMLLGLRGAALAAVSGAACYVILVACLLLGWVAPPPDQAIELYRISSSEAVYYVVVTLLMLVVVTSLAGYLAERLRIFGGRLERAEERAAKAERMAALGQLAAGLAHEIRNPLGGIAGSIQLLRDSSALTNEDRELCEIIQREAERLNDLVTDMMDLTRRRQPMLEDVDAADVAREVVALASKSGRGASDVRVVYEGEEEARVRADAAQLRQLIWNLVKNAVQASGAGDEVKVSVTAKEGTPPELAVADQGVGIDDVDSERLFDAFFTTRSQGTGVGLAVVKAIADAHGFEIEVSSEKGRGATFRVRLGSAAG